MAEPFEKLEAQMSPQARKKAKKLTEKMLADIEMAEMALNELRAARKLSQEAIAQSLHVKQAAVSKMERRTDMYISTLRQFIAALGGDLEIIARFPDGCVQINQFSELDNPQAFA